MIKQILKQIINQRFSNAWLWVELFLVSIFLWFVLDNIFVVNKVYFDSTGFNIEHTYRVSLNELLPNSEGYIPVEKKSTTSSEDLVMIMNRMRTIPGVEAVSYSFFSYPYCGGNSSATFKMDTVSIQLMKRKITPDFLRVFRVTDTDGNTEPLFKAFYGENSVLVSEDTEKELMKDGQSLVGKLLMHPSDSIGKKVVGITTKIRYTEFTKAEPCIFSPIAEAEIAKNDSPDIVSNAEICIRVSPNADHDFVTTFRNTMDKQIKVGNIFLVDIKSFSDIRESYLQVTGDFNELKTRLAIASFLLINIFLGIIGTFWFRTSYRKSEMGLRLALGSTRGNLRNLLIVEGLVILTLAIVPAAIVCYNIGHAELVDVVRVDFGIIRFMTVTLVTYLLMSAMILLGIWYPARQAMNVQPAEVLHEQ